ncbi:TetR/AcrR family transcriptional regulator [Thermodesulfobacteriota bacterium]
MEAHKLSRKEREFATRRHEILDAALKLFSEKGFHNVTMQEIAQESEFAVGTLYKFFPNKEALFEGLLRVYYDYHHSKLMDAIDGGNGEMESIRNFLKTHISVFKDNLDWVRLYYGETRGGSFNIGQELREEIREKHNHMLEELAGIFKKGMNKRIFKKTDPYHLAIVLEAITSAFSRHYYEKRDENAYNPDMIMKIFLESNLEGPVRN